MIIITEIFDRPVQIEMLAIAGQERTLVASVGQRRRKEGIMIQRRSSHLGQHVGTTQCENLGLYINLPASE